jgi:hypothetical protein
MRATLFGSDLAVIETDLVDFWALNPSFGDGELSICAEVVDNEGELLTMEFQLDRTNVIDMLRAIDEWREINEA